MEQLESTARALDRLARTGNSFPGCKVAIIHYWLVGMRGGERVLERLLHLFPEADIFTHVYDPAAVSDVIRRQQVRTTFIQKLPRATSLYQKYLPLMPMALEQLDLRGYDLVISSESGPAKGVIAPPDALHLCYCHSPMRYLWDHFADYRNSAGFAARMTMPLVFPGLRQWDQSSAARVDRIVANSNFIRQRIRRTWRRDSVVVHPPVPVQEYALPQDTRDFYLWVGQLTRYKRADLAVEAFNKLRLPLLMIGQGDLEPQLREIVGPNIVILPKLKFAELKKAYASCKALIFTAEEDFGIIPVEVNASGRPVIGYGRGGLLDSIIDGQTGLYFKEQEIDSLVDAVQRFERWQGDFEPALARRNASRFAPEIFDAGILDQVTAGLAER